MRAERRFPYAFASIAAARRFVGGTLSDAGQVEEVVEPAELVVSELATNAIRHARSYFSVVVEIEGVVRVSVYDNQPGEVTALTPNATATTGRGLRIVAALGDRWGVEQAAGGKWVWWELEVEPLT